MWFVHHAAERELGRDARPRQFVVEADQRALALNLELGFERVAEQVRVAPRDRHALAQRRRRMHRVLEPAAPAETGEIARLEAERRIARARHPVIERGVRCR